jgi:hypothetical protein
MAEKQKKASFTLAAENFLQDGNFSSSSSLKSTKEKFWRKNFKPQN